jgi:hypothetical protein
VNESGKPKPLTDADRGAFLRALDRAEFAVTDWEAQFLGRNLDTINFTLAQRDAISRMIEQYGERLGF